MKLACLTTSYPRFSGDLAGTFVKELNQSLTARGHDVLVLAPRSPLPREAEPKGVVVEEVPYLMPRTLEQTFYDAGALDNVTRSPAAALGAATFPLALLAHAARRTADCDALLAHWAIPSGVVASLVSRGRPHVVVFHSADVHALVRTQLAAPVMRRLLASRASLVFVASVLRERLCRALPEELARAVHGRSYVLSMGFSPAACAKRREDVRAELGLRRFTVVTLGRLVPIKGLDVLIRALESLDLDLAVLGDGPDRRRLEALVSATNANVRFVGRVDERDKWRWLAAADLFAMPSLDLGGRTEGLPVALLEAMHAGLPVVATRTGGIPEALEEDAGYLVPPGNVRALREATLSLMHDDAMRDAYARRGRARSRDFEWSVLAPKFEALLTATG